MGRFVSRHPIIFSVLAVVFAIAIVRLLDVGLGYLKVSEITTRLVVEAVLCAYVGLLLTTLQWWRRAGFRRAASSRKLLACLPLLFLPVLVLITSGLKSASFGDVIWIAVLTLMVGFAEEGLLRGVVLQALLPGGLTRAVLLSSALFGVGHVINLLQGYSLSMAVVQLINNTLLGIGFAGVLLYTGTIWPIVVVHAVVDFVDFGSRGFAVGNIPAPTTSGIIVTIAITSLYALYGWMLLRRTGKSGPDIS